MKSIQLRYVSVDFMLSKVFLLRVKQDQGFIWDQHWFSSVARTHSAGSEHDKLGIRALSSRIIGYI